MVHHLELEPGGPAALAAPFPLTGHAHPLRKRSVQMLYRAFCAAVIFHLVAGAAFLVLRSRESSEPPAGIHIFTVLPAPPAINPHPRVAVDVSVVNQPAIGIPLPVPDFVAPDVTLMENAAIPDAVSDLKLFDADGSGRDSLVVQLPSGDGNRSPAPNEFVAAEEMPVLISFPAPAYPSLARQAEVEGTVRLRLLVGRDGKVKDVLVTQGIEMLNDAAVFSARSAVFRPALQQHRPVEVWVEVPVTFRLNG